MSNYPPIEDHGLIGDLQTAALIATEGTIDWMCVPRFDSPSIFASLLDKKQGGSFRIHATGDGIVTRQMYLAGTAILVTRFMSEEGVGEVIDFMPPAGKDATDRHKLVRLINVVRGRMRFEAQCNHGSITAGRLRRWSSAKAAFSSRAAVRPSTLASRQSRRLRQTLRCTKKMAVYSRR